MTDQYLLDMSDSFLTNLPLDQKANIRKVMEAFPGLVELRKGAYTGSGAPLPGYFAVHLIPARGAVSMEAFWKMFRDIRWGKVK